uniref:Putative secreted protein n=1 Tax=Anopheles darlingi TaxID=43151 RepID=A0A2M4DFD2_ANODA
MVIKIIINVMLLSCIVSPSTQQCSCASTHPFWHPFCRNPWPSTAFCPPAHVSAYEAWVSIHRHWHCVYFFRLPFCCVTF